MALSDFIADLDALAADAQQAFDGAADQAALEEARVTLLGAKAGRLKAIQKGMGKVDKADKPAAGQKLNAVKSAVEAALEAATARLAAGAGGAEREAFDASVPGRPLRIGRLHPITQTIGRMKEIMGRLGFTAVEGPEIEDDWHNFEALNISPAHPARDPLDNFYLSVGTRAGEAGAGEAEGPAPGSQPPTPDRQPPAPAAGPDGKPLLLRSQTSTVQIRVMEQSEPPVRIVSLGRVYRPDTADATHYPMFHQIEGLLVDEGVTMADLKSVLRMFCQAYFAGEDGQRGSIDGGNGGGKKGDGGDSDVHIRFRPSFFPFTEPSVEVDIYWSAANGGKGGWMEIGGAGMVDPNVLKAVGYDPEKVTGFAFGMGVERFCMRQHQIRDIRDLYANDVRFLEQF
ncbi:MAG: phenylalanine--tRNA ligase subunit alpha [Planctomycetota bacterium]